MPPAEATTGTRRSKWLLLFKTIVSAGIIVYLASKVDLNLLAGLSWNLPWMVLAGCLINLSALAIMASRWRALIHTATGTHVELRLLFGYYLIGAFYNNLLPGAIGGDFIRIKRLVDHHHVRWGLAVRITLIERLMGLTGVILFASATLPFAHLPNSWRGIVPAPMLTWVSALGIICFIVVNVCLCRSLGASISPRKTVGISALVVLGQIGDMCTLAMFLAVLGTPIGAVNLIFSVSLAYLAAVLPISLGGLGVREGVLTAMLTLNGIDIASAALLSVVLLCSRLMTAGIGIAVDVRSSR